MTTDLHADAISVLIRTFDSEKALRRLLGRLKLHPGDELIVVDSGSTDRTLAVAAEYAAQIVHAPPPFNYSKSLNLGFRSARNPWVLAISSHTVPLVPDLVEVFRIAAKKFPAQVLVGYGINSVDRKKLYPDDEIRLGLGRHPPGLRDRGGPRRAHVECEPLFPALHVHEGIFGSTRRSGPADHAWGFVPGPALADQALSLSRHAARQQHPPHRPCAGAILRFARPGG